MLCVCAILTIHAISILSSMRQALLIIGATIDANNKENSINKWQKESQSIPFTGSVMVVELLCPAQLKSTDSKCVVVGSTAQSSDGGSGGGDVTLFRRTHKPSWTGHFYMYLIVGVACITTPL